jgi:hypothetical protein
LGEETVCGLMHLLCNLPEEFSRADITMHSHPNEEYANLHICFGLCLNSSWEPTFVGMCCGVCGSWMPYSLKYSQIQPNIARYFEKMDSMSISVARRLHWLDSWRYWVTAYFLLADIYNHHSWWVCSRGKEYIFVYNSRPQFWQYLSECMICSLITSVLPFLVVPLCCNCHFRLKPFQWLKYILLIFYSSYIALANSTRYSIFT